MGKRKAVINGEVKLVTAVWEPIVSESTFALVETILKNNYRRYKSPSSTRFPYQLSGLLFCKTCGDRLCGKTAHGRIGKVAYYEHSWATRRQACLNKKIFDCKPNRILAKTLETHVWEKVEDLLINPKNAEYLIQKSKEKHKNQSHITGMERLKRKLQGIKEQIEALAEHLSKIPKGISPLPIFNQMQKLETLKTETERDLNAFIESGVVVDEPSQLKDYQAYLNAIRNIQGFTDSAILKSKIIKLLVAKIELLPNSFKLHYFIGKSVTTQSQILGAEQPSALGPNPSSPFLNFGSNSLTNGGC